MACSQPGPPQLGSGLWSMTKVIGSVCSTSCEKTESGSSESSNGDPSTLKSCQMTSTCPGSSRRKRKKSTLVSMSPLHTDSTQVSSCSADSMKIPGGGAVGQLGPASGPTVDSSPGALVPPVEPSREPPVEASPPCSPPVEDSSPMSGLDDAPPSVSAGPVASGCSIFPAPPPHARSGNASSSTNEGSLANASLVVGGCRHGTRAESTPDPHRRPWRTSDFVPFTRPQKYTGKGNDNRASRAGALMWGVVAAKPTTFPAR